MEERNITGEKPAPTFTPDGKFAPGNKLGGRPKGSRNKLGEDFLKALSEDFEAHGPGVIATVRSERPADYLKVCASILPKELTIKVDPLEEMSDGELDRYIRQLAAILSVETGVSSGAASEAASTAH